MQISETRFRPTPPDDSALKLRVVQTVDQRAHGQFTIENGEGSIGGEWDRYYVNLSGYCGEHNPGIFAAAPELYNELEVREGDLVMLLKAIEAGDPKAELLVRVGDMLRETRAALAKATAA